MTAEIIAFPRSRPCACRLCQAVERNWRHFGAKQSLAEFLAEHALYPHDPPHVALAIIADKGRSPLARSQARTILVMVKYERMRATPDDAA